jgi:hypothetical protein
MRLPLSGLPTHGRAALGLVRVLAAYLSSGGSVLTAGPFEVSLVSKRASKVGSVGGLCDAFVESVRVAMPEVSEAGDHAGGDLQALLAG